MGAKPMSQLAFIISGHQQERGQENEEESCGDKPMVLLTWGDSPQVHAEEKVFQGRDPAVPVPAERHGRLESRRGGDLVVQARSYPCWDCKWLTRLSAPVLGGVLCSGLPLCDLYNMS